MKALRIAFYGNFGSGNLGNECTLQTTIEHVRRYVPDARMLCICTVPEDVLTRHQIPAILSTARASGWSWMSVQAESAANSRMGPPAASPSQPTANSAQLLQEEAAATGALRFLARWARRIFHRVPLEIAHWVQSLRMVLRTDMLIVPGTQVVSDYLTGPLSWPYDIFKLSILAALCRVRLVFLSIGVGPVYHPLSRWFIKTSLNLADFRSYRDEGSLQYARSIGVRIDRDRVYPDLAFGLQSSPSPSAADRIGSGLVVGLGLKDYGADDVDNYRDYLETMATFAAWLCEQGYAVRLLIGDVQYDMRVRGELLAMLQKRDATALRSLVVSEVPLTVEHLQRQLASTDIVVSPRFHNLLLAAKLDKPIIALSDHAKLDSLMAGLGLEHYCVPLARLDPASLIVRFEELVEQREQMIAHIRSEVQRSRRALDEQYALVFGPLQAR